MPEYVTVRAVVERGKIRLRTDNAQQLYIQSPVDWRKLAERGALITIRATLRSDKKCLVMQPVFTQPMR